MPNRAQASTLAAILEYAIWAATDFDPSGHAGLFGTFLRDRWKIQDDGALRRQSTTSTYPHNLFDALSKASPDLHNAALNAIANDPLFAPWLGGLIGTAASGATQFSAETLINGCVAKQITDTDKFLPDADRVRAHFHDIERYFYEDTASATLLMPIPGLAIDNPEQRLNCGERIVFGKFGASHFEACANVGIIAPMFPDHPFIDAHSGIGCSATVDVPIVRLAPGAPGLLPEFGNPTKRHFGSLDWWAVNEVGDDILFVLRLAGREKVTSPGLLLVADGPLAHSIQYFRRPPATFARTQYRIDDSTSRRIVDLWNALAGSRRKRQLPRICVRRFNAAVDIRSKEDAVADITIAAEALFLSDNPSEREE